MKRENLRGASSSLSSSSSNLFFFFFLIRIPRSSSRKFYVILPSQFSLSSTCSPRLYQISMVETARYHSVQYPKTANYLNQPLKPYPPCNFANLSEFHRLNSHPNVAVRGQEEEPFDFTNNCCKCQGLGWNP